MAQTIIEPQVEQIYGDKLDHYWPFIVSEMDRVPHIWSAWWTKEAIYEGLSIGMLQLWAAGTKDAIHIVLITQVVVYPASRVVQCFLTFGKKIDEYIPILAATMESFARDQGCASVDVWGRDGWTKKLLKQFHGVRRMTVLSFPVSKERTN